MRRAVPQRIAAVAALTASLGAAACVDLFHATDFDTLCERTPSACAAGAADGGGPALPPPENATTLCSGSPGEARARAERACAWMTSCLGTAPSSSLGACIVRAQAAYSCSLNPGLRPQGKTAALWGCLASAATCEAVSGCLFDAGAPSCVPTTGGGSFRACSNDEPSVSAVTCGSSATPTSIEHCALEGRSCARIDLGDAVCAGVSGTACDGAARCAGTAAVHCSSGPVQVDLGRDCAAFGAGRCVVDTAGAACAPGDDAPSCAGSSKVTCDVGAAQSCVDGKSVVIACGELGLDCDAADATPSDPVSACKARRDAPGWCDTERDTCGPGGALSSCAHGAVFTLDCLGQGLGACVEAAEPTGHAACAKP